MLAVARGPGRLATHRDQTQRTAILPRPARPASGAAFSNHLEDEDLSGSDKAYEYRADLAQTALPEMLFTVDRFRVPGVVEAERAGVVKRVYIKEGLVVHATSTDRDDSLGSYLLRTGRLTPADFERTMAERAATNRRYGHLLIEQKLLSPVDIYRAVREQVEAIVWSLFYWEEGQVRFRIGTFEETGAVRIQLPMHQVILGGIKRAPNAKALVARLGQRDTVFEPCFRMEDLIEAGIDQAEYELLSQIDGQRSLYDLCQEGPLSPADNAKLLYAFQVLRLMRRQQAAPTGVDQAAASGVAGAAAPGTDLVHAAEAGAAPPRTPHPEPDPPRVEVGESSGRKVIKIKFKTSGDRFAG